MSDSSDFRWEVRHKLDILRCALDWRQIGPLVNLQPVAAWNKGDPWPLRRTTYAFSRWIHETPEWTGDTAEMNRGEHVETLRNLIKHIFEHRAALDTLRPSAEISVETVIHSDSFNVAYGLPADCAALLGQMQVGWYVDIYAMPSARPDGSELRVVEDRD